MVQIGPLILEAACVKSMGHFDPLIGRGVVWVVFIHATFSFVVRDARPATESKVHFEPLIFKNIVQICRKSGSGLSDHHQNQVLVLST